MSPLHEHLECLLERRDLAESQAEHLLMLLANSDDTPALSGAIIASLRCKGVVADELRGFARAMRKLALRPLVPEGLRAIDIVGTGGDGSNSLNISTGTAILAAACGLPVIKHGNRSVSSRAGSADVLAALGLKLPLDERDAAACLAATGFTFLFAPYYHPAMKAVAPIRAALGVRTVFNILGPLSNPAQPPFHLLGAFSLQTAELMAEAMSGLPIERAFVIHGAAGWDEPTTVGPFVLFDVRPGQVSAETRTPEDFGLARCAVEALIGGDPAHNASAIREVLANGARNPYRDCLLLGAALALELTGETTVPTEAVARAADAIDSGAARRVLDSLAGFSA
ncbi:MAG TPA: anthranilate phosphoribosyltransferase [Steroidobacteraceae bacterium]|nr:anthranilate phosphoribosyltransferase [Steroidobacteraceae bacterium]